MNTPLRRLATVVLLMFLALMGAATYIQFVKAPELNADNRNSRRLFQEYGTFRGSIIVGGEQVAWSEPVDDVFRYQRKYEPGTLYAPVTGFYSVVFGATGVEGTENLTLTGQADSLVWQRLQDLVTGRQPVGSSVELTIDPEAQKAAYDALGDQKGAVVAIEPATGRILALVSKPTFDPSDLAGHSTSKVNERYQKLDADKSRPLVNRAIGGDTYPPGSTFKLVVAAAALENGYEQTAELDAPRELALPQSSSTIKNFGGAACSSTDKATLAESLRISCNTSFAKLGLTLGADALAAQAADFGFGTDVEIPLKATPSRFPTGLNAPNTALSAIGQYEVRATPLQMAMVSAAIANGGVQMQPHLVSRVLSPDLEVLSRTQPTELRRSVSASTAAVLTSMMQGVVENGTGRSARISGVSVAGKTGTAQTAPDVAPHAWFTAFAPADDPKVAVAVVVENGGSMGDEGTGGQVAAPIAKRVIEAVLR